MINTGYDWFIFFATLITGAMFGALAVMIFSGKRDTYRCGQIDAIRGIIKYKLKRNAEGEEVWTKIDE